MANDKANRDTELQNARNKKAGYERQKSSYESKIRSNNEKIARLRAAKKTLGEIKDRLQKSSKAQKKYAEKEDTYLDWTGDKRNTVQEIYAVSTPAEYKIYIERVDIALDFIVAEETALENSNLDMFGIIGDLVSWINSLAGKIEQLCN